MLLGGIKPNDILINSSTMEVKFRSFEAAIMLNSTAKGPIQEEEKEMTH